MTDKTKPDRATLLPLFSTGWALTEDGETLVKTFLFRDFKQAFGFMTRVAEDAEALGHHPEWSNTYRTVNVRLTTHDAGGLTGLDVALAQKMDEAAGY